jgi:hypothetical protein
MMPSCLPPEQMSDTVDQVLGAAMRLAGIVHLEDPAESLALIAGLDGQQRALLPFILAALVDIDRTPGELLSWVPGYQAPKRLARATAAAPPSVLLDQVKARQHDAECGTHGGFLRHVKHGEPVDAECGIAEKAWRRTARPKRRRRGPQQQLELPLEVTAA